MGNGDGLSGVIISCDLITNFSSVPLGCQLGLVLLGLMKTVMMGLKTIAPSPKPATTPPATIPLNVGNH